MIYLCILEIGLQKSIIYSFNRNSKMNNIILLIRLI